MTVFVTLEASAATTPAWSTMYARLLKVYNTIRIYIENHTPRSYMEHYKANVTYCNQT